MGNQQPDEVWMPYPSDPAFSVSNLGRVKGIRKHLRSDHRGKDGYHRMTLRGGPQQTRTIHSMVAETFLGERPPGMVVAHKDGNKSNNAASNLIYVDERANSLHRRFHKTGVCPLVRRMNGTLEVSVWRGAASGKARGGDHGHATTTEDQARAVIALGKEGIPNVRIASRLGVSQQVVSQILTFRSWKHLPR